MVSVSSRNGKMKAQLRAENKQGARLSLGKRVFRVRAELPGRFLHLDKPLRKVHFRTPL